MHYCFPPFNINDSLKGKTPKWIYKEQFNYISKGAFGLLKNRPIKTIEFGALDINRIRQIKTHEIAIELIRKGEKDVILNADYENYKELNAPTPSTMLVTQLSNLNIDNEKYFPSARHYEYLAILSLMLIGFAIEIEDQLKSASSKKEEEELISLIGALTFNSLEALSLADKFHLEPPKVEIQNKNNKPISLRNKKAADARHGERHLLKLKFLKYYCSNPPSNKIDAIRPFIEGLSSDELDLLHPYDHQERIRFFYRVLSDYKKGKFL